MGEIIYSSGNESRVQAETEQCCLQYSTTVRLHAEWPDRKSFRTAAQPRRGFDHETVPRQAYQYWAFFFTLFAEIVAVWVMRGHSEGEHLSCLLLVRKAFAPRWLVA